MNKTEFQSREVDYAEWRLAWDKIEFANFLQSWGYGEAKKHQGWTPRRFIIEEKGGAPAALLQVLVKTYPLIGGLARINRGPLMIGGSDASSDIGAVWKEVRQLSKRNKWRVLQAAPELRSENGGSRELADAGFKKMTKKSSYGSTALALGKDTDELMKGLNGKWRNLLRKGLKLGTPVEPVTDPQQLRELAKIYESYQSERGFSGVPAPLMDGILSSLGNDLEMRVFQTRSEADGSVSGFIFSIEHGDTATYLVGWTSDTGRSQQSNYLLLWEAIQAAKASGKAWYDMGGLTENTPKGIAHFKKGLQGEPYTLLGEFRCPF